MYALSFTQPWATLVALGAKRIETRSWSTSFRGPLVIHAAKAFPQWCRDLCREEPFCRFVPVAEALPRGMLVGTVVILKVVPTEVCLQTGISDIEKNCGDYTAGRSAWILSHAQPLLHPIPCRGQMGIWRVPLGLWEE